MPRLRLTGAGFVALALLLSGCGSRVIDLREPPDPDPVPEPSSPQAAVLRVQWAWNHRDPEPLRDLLTSDYRYFETRADTGDAFELFRQSELMFSNHLFETGTATRPPATAVTFVFANPVADEPSSVPGHDPGWHREVVATLHLGVRVPDGDYRVIGPVRFGLVRGDSARIPQELLDRGYLPDANRWWIERWVDEVQPVSGVATPSEPFTLSALKAIYLDLPPPAEAAGGLARRGD
jgi:hypothetical protein